MVDREFATGRVLVGSCLDRLKELADCSVDSVVTDPPYELGFMGKKWDASGIAYNVELWAEVLRVLKPGGHLLAFGGTRTYHRMAVAIEDAGFEIRDSIHWVYGSGFPKSLNVSKAIDKACLLPHEKRFCAWVRDHSGLDAKTVKRLTGSDRFFTGEVQVVNTATADNPRWGRRAMVPTASAWAKLIKAMTVTPPDWVTDLVKSPPGPAIEHPSDWKAGKGEGTVGTNEWAGWGTALKPAHEPVVLARKPLDGTVAANVQEYGTGALNIDGCRVGTEAVITTNGKGFAGSFAGGANNNGGTQHVGRWPANIIFDEAAGAELDAQSGTSKSTPSKPTKRKASVTGDQRTATGAGMYAEGAEKVGHNHNDIGGASRFFYCPKPGKKERNAGLDGLEVKRPDTRTETGMGTFEEKGVQPQRNFHPCVKPVTLMRYLCRLITPPNGTVLDPFLGSGTTAVAAIKEGFTWIGCEMTEDYLPIIEGRVVDTEESPENKTLFESEA